MFHVFDHARAPRRLIRYLDARQVVHFADGDSIWTLCEHGPYTMPLIQEAQATTALVTCTTCWACL